MEPKFTAVIDPLKGPPLLEPGRVMNVNGTRLVIIQHIDHLPGHYLATPDLSRRAEGAWEGEGELLACAARIVFYAPTKRWAEQQVDGT